MYIYVYTNVCMYLCLCVCIYTNAYYIYIYIYIYVSVCEGVLLEDPENNKRRASLLPGSEFGQAVELRVARAVGLRELPDSEAPCGCFCRLGVLI